jgi:hypothetical protein
MYVIIGRRNASLNLLPALVLMFMLNLSLFYGQSPQPIIPELLAKFACVMFPRSVELLRSRGYVSSPSIVHQQLFNLNLLIIN